MKDIDAEIARVKEALKKTESPYLRRDYQKHLKRLYAEKNER